MKKLLILIGLFCFSFALDAQTSTDEEMDRMRDQMRESMEEMMKIFDGAFDMAEGPMIKLDTMIFKSFGDIDENGEPIPNGDMQAFFEQMQKMMQEQFGDLDFGEMTPFEDEPLIPGPDDIDEEKEYKTPKEATPAKKKKKRKSYSL